jgi:hypothetical protein
MHDIRPPVADDPSKTKAEPDIVPDAMELENLNARFDPFGHRSATVQAADGLNEFISWQMIDEVDYAVLQSATLHAVHDMQQSHASRILTFCRVVVWL